MILLFTVPTFLLFVLCVEGAAYYNWLDSIKSEIDRTLGRADWVFPSVRSRQAWMRTNLIKSYTN